ncbi:MAG: altronate dehydratase family protein [Treponema sp.]|jgi:altronate hydrolase|nr:altronate dehydratase family protein [Treponema sp.]
MSLQSVETAPALFRIHDADTVAVALRPLAGGETLPLPGGGAPLRIAGAVPAGHKVSLVPMAKGSPVIKYGYPIGEAAADIPAGVQVHTGNLRTRLSEKRAYEWKGGAAVPAPCASPPLLSLYPRADGQTGTRNELWIIPTVGCVNRTAEALAAWGNQTLAGERSGISGVYAWPHPYGCSQMGDDHEATRRVLASLARHPNAGAVLVLSLGCENNTLAGFKEALGPAARDPRRIAFLETQACADEIAEGRALLAELARYGGGAVRKKMPASSLVVGMKCGGSDGFSGITANALVGRLCDRLCALGAKVILTEVPEIFGAEQMLLDRCETRAVYDSLVTLIDDFKAYYTRHGQPVFENPSPGNKAGGISTLEDKSCGCVQKGGAAPVRGVLRYGERAVDAPAGLLVLEGPGNDIVSTTALTAAGAQALLFTTGRGTPLGAPVPTIKVSSNSGLAARKSGWIDFDAGRMLSEDPAALCDALEALLFAVAEGACTKNEKNGYREIAIFKNGVTL